ncbi:WYL domain-containing protein [Hoeflea halophila]|uniref:WYL domain-containing protein n=1 Tax=Hoeflea halophila TaxID=714899 RepID=A0A286IFP0_9HYPH|nr:YafY family protein [Hoeflea halophila]SOE18920.1 WYL domain-containing protein [Hoeflea halophila]
MSRAARLLDLLQVFRRYRHPVSGAALAEELGVSLRTIYRDIEALKAQGAAIDGEAGVGFVLKPGFMLPPLMFSEDEIEALVLGSRWVAERADQPLGAAARNALVKIGAVLPPDLRAGLDDSTLLVAGGSPLAAGESELPRIRDAIRRQRKLTIAYADVNGASSERVIWPIALAFFDRARVIVAWCELRNDFRHFRADRVIRLEVETNTYPHRRATLMKQWQAKEGIALRSRQEKEQSMLTRIDSIKQ